MFINDKFYHRYNELEKQLEIAIQDKRKLKEEIDMYKKDEAYAEELKDYQEKYVCTYMWVMYYSTYV